MDPDKCSPRVKRGRHAERRDQKGRGGISESTKARKAWQQLNREDICVAQVNRKASDEGYGLNKRSVSWSKNQRPRLLKKSLVGSADLVCRNFTAFRPNQLQVADLTYALAKRPCLRSVHNRRIYQVHCMLPCPRSLNADLAFDALKQALYALRGTKGLIHSSVNGS